MNFCGQSFGLSEWSDLISILTPFILLIWFYYSQRQTLSKNYFDEIGGIYAGFTEPTVTPIHNGKVHSGIIMNIRDVDSKGFFKGDFDYAETESFSVNQKHLFRTITDGVYSFFGDMEFELYRDKKRHPFKVKENRSYKGSLYVVDRMDFQIDNFKLEDYIIAEYRILHYREMETIKFTLKKTYRTGAQKLPENFVLYKSSGLNFEPYKNLKMVVFPITRVDQ